MARLKIRISAAAVMMTTLFLCGCEREYVSPQVSMDSVSFDNVVSAADGALEKNIQSYSEAEPYVEACLGVLCSLDSTTSMRENAEALLSELTAALPEGEQRNMLFRRITLGYLGESNYYTSYERMLTTILGGTLSQQERDRLYKDVMRQAYRIYMPLFEEAFALLEDGDAALRDMRREILLEADGSDVYFVEVYQTVCSETEKTLNESFNVNQDDVLAAFERALLNTDDPARAVSLMKKAPAVNLAKERAALFTDIFLSNGIDCQGMDKAGAFTVPDRPTDDTAPVCDLMARIYTVEYSDGSFHDSVFIIPKINSDAPGARSLNYDMEDELTGYDEFLESINRSLGNYDWDGWNQYVSYTYSYETDGSVITIEAVKTVTKLGGSPETTTYVYSYDSENDERVD